MAIINLSDRIQISRKRILFPDMQKRLRVVAISDIHAPSTKFSISELVRIVNAQSADIFILAGDIIDKKGSESLVRHFALVSTRLAKLAVLGNWEYKRNLNISKLKDEYEKIGMRLLINNISKISGITFFGLDDLIGGKPNFNIIRKTKTGSKPMIVISHCPESFDYLPIFSKFSLIVISGHTHGGQIAPFGIALCKPRGSGGYIGGWYYKGNNSMYVMRGIGTSGFPIRIGARPEILVLDLCSSF